MGAASAWRPPSNANSDRREPEDLQEAADLLARDSGSVKGDELSERHRHKILPLQQGDLGAVHGGAEIEADQQIASLLLRQSPHCPRVGVQEEGRHDTVAAGGLL